MLLEARNLTKFYGDFLAVDRASFAVERGEIVALLGPNGAGKTTTMRMLSCFLAPTEGSATVAGYDIAEDPMEARRRIGYMPENNPLYGEMRVREYLRFRADLKGVPRLVRTERIGECVDMCGVSEVRRQVIRTLSKGYRQRVGLADALLGDPDVLILDEPTIGLDPNQVRQTRATIQVLSERHTILLSTHILQEVEAVCKRVLIINRGTIVADDTVENLSRQTTTGTVTAEIQGDADSVRAALLAVPEIRKVELEASGEWCVFRITPTPEADVREAIAALAARNGWPLRELTRKRVSMEEVFYRITVRGGEKETAGGE